VNKQIMKSTEQANTYNNENEDVTEYIYERCQKCGRHLTKIKNIRVGVDDDAYYCIKCVNKYNIESVPCRDL
jgi:predicted SprT family Zn-dependent metalloprotease